MKSSSVKNQKLTPSAWPSRPVPEAARSGFLTIRCRPLFHGVSMFSKWRRVSQSALLTPLLFAIIAAMPATARGDSLSLATEVQMEDQASQNLIVQALFGSIPGDSLTYSSTMSSAGDSFSYATTSGSMFLGQPISVSANATMTSPQPDEYDWTITAAGTLGSSMWTVVDPEVVKKNANGSYTVTSDYDYFDKNGNKVGDLHITVFVDKDVTMDTDTGYFTDKNGNKQWHSDFTSTSQYVGDGNWRINVKPSYQDSQQIPNAIDTTGFTPLNGGAGSFTPTFTTVPEPSSWRMLVLGTLSLLAYEWRRRKARA